MRWLAGCSPTILAQAVRAVAPALGGTSIEIRERAVEDDPLWWSSTAVVDGRFIAKFAWSRPAALRLAHEIGVLTALAGEPFLPEVVASSTDPLLLVTRREPGTSLFEIVDSIDRDRAGRQLAAFLARLHDPATRARVETAVGPLAAASAGPQHPPSTQVLLEGLEPDQSGAVSRWCQWADAALARPRPAVVVHADLHGDNQIWAGDELRIVVDFENVSLAEPEYDLRAFPGTGPGVELLTATTRHYERITGRHLSIDRVMAWHLRTVLGDTLWRGGPLPIDDLAARFAELGID
ncbi:phosphotransferase family enzyme [Asanoa ferruginea]|uniref:Phosphotransferase family enzyme n=1 Tax=Asanoa ferruginea TaxID=53367 RepID=A0A3D9ZS88_9ACTN|nr:phosphotransferase [Asanoa ferruginea]REF99322.1 phosphotransferase family enzyme [Asanoa ferruginea]GIF45924.1 hypothetical protein Afe04nite_04630 [Asanoa ferruginea]